MTVAIACFDLVGVWRWGHSFWSRDWNPSTLLVKTGNLIWLI
jgi:hypothetical protein